jgi:hypothetical protein
MIQLPEEHPEKAAVQYGLTLATMGVSYKELFVYDAE